MTARLTALLAACIATVASASAADKITIGFITTLTTSAAPIGKDMRDGASLALEHADGRMGGKPATIIFEDDGFRPETGKKRADKLIKRDQADFVAGFIWPGVLMAARRSVLDSGRFLISAGAVPSVMAGQQCHQNFFSSGWQPGQAGIAAAALLARRGAKSVYAIMPGDAAGKDLIESIRRSFKGKLAGQMLTRWGKDAQLDFTKELAGARASGAEALVAFYPGKAGQAFVDQYRQAGLDRTMPLVTAATLDALALPGVQRAKSGSLAGIEDIAVWSPDLDVPANKRFVADFKAKHGRVPSAYAAQSYDAILLIKSAVDAVRGDLTDKDAVRAALAAARFASVRGAFQFGRNHVPVQNVYRRKAVEGAGGVWTTKIIDTVLRDQPDPYAKDCRRE